MPAAAYISPAAPAVLTWCVLAGQDKWLDARVYRSPLRMLRRSRGPQEAGYKRLPERIPVMNGAQGDGSRADGGASRNHDVADIIEGRDKANALWHTLVDEGLQQPVGPTKQWLHIDAEGVTSMVEVDKHRLVQELRLRYRDLLALDPSIPLPFPSAILIRERALVVNLESVRLIICAHEVFVLSVPKDADPQVATRPSPDNAFVRRLAHCLRTGKSSAQLQAPGAQSLSRLTPPTFDFSMPYELRALEVALATTTSILDKEVFDLEEHGYPVIDEMLSSVSKEVLEAVRGVKSKMQKLIGRVSRIKTELEEILSDDADMQDMYLGRRELLLGEDGSPLHSSHPSQQDLHAAQQRQRFGRSAPDLQSLGQQQQLQQGQGLAHHRSAADLAGQQQGLSRHSTHSAASTHSSVSHLQQLQGAHEGSTSRHAARHAGGEGGDHLEPLLPERHHDAAGSLAAERALRPAPQHLHHHLAHSATELAATAGRSSPLGRGQRGSGHVHKTGQGQRPPQRPSAVVRTIRRVSKSKKRGQRKSSAEAVLAGAAGGGAGGMEASRLSSASQELPQVPVSPESDVDDDSSDENDIIEETFIDLPQAPAVDPHDIEDAEDLLESYFIQVDYILRRLLLLNERIDATEDFVEIQLDSKRNELFAIELFVSTLTGAFAWVAMLAGIFGMNLWNTVWQQNVGVFVAVIVCCGVGGLMLFSAILLWIKRRNLLPVMFVGNVYVGNSR